MQGRVDDLYFGILLLDEQLLQTDYTLGLLRSNLDKVRALQRNGVAMQTDADAVEAELLTVNQQRTQVAATRDSYRRMLGVFIGRRLDGETLVCPDVAEPASFEPERPELALFDARIDQARGTGGAGQIGDPPPLRAFRAGILRVSGAELHAGHDEQ